MKNNLVKVIRDESPFLILSDNELPKSKTVDGEKGRESVFETDERTFTVYVRKSDITSIKAEHPCNIIITTKSGETWDISLVGLIKSDEQGRWTANIKGLYKALTDIKNWCR
jgi:5-deoxy-D-glucuronate isomerase